MRTSFVVMAAIVTFMSGSNAIQITGDDKYERVLRKPMAIKDSKLNDKSEETPSHTEPTVTPGTSDDKDDELEKKPKRRDGV